MNPDMLTEDEARRLTALNLAVKIAAEQQTGRYNGDIIVNIAGAFETYLKEGGKK